MESMQLDRISEAILGLHPPLEGSEQHLSLALYRLLAAGEAVSSEALASAAGVERAQAETVLSGWPGIYRDARSRVIGYWGLTIAKTKHRMLIAGKLLHAWCAWDTLFLPELLETAASVESSCPVTGTRIALQVGPEGVEAEGKRPLVSFISPDPQKAADDVVRNFCHFIYFFATEQAARKWTAEHPAAVLATLDEACQLGRRRNARYYPGRQFSSGPDRSRSAIR